MTPNDVDLVKSSFAKVAPIKDKVPGIFYGRLFEIAPEVRPMFKGDMEEQGSKLIQTIAFVVNGLDDLGSVLPAAQDLARRHVDYGTKPEHYPVVGAALLWTLEQGLGDDFTDEVKAAWTTAYGALSGAMIEAAYPSETA